MSSRQARRERREAERKAKKAELKRAKAATEIGFVSQNEPSAATERGFVSQIELDPTPLPAEDQGRTRAEINRANAQHSTGPRSETGKLASSRNSLKHGLASGTVLVAGEDPAAFEKLKNALSEEHQPATETEILLVTEIAQSWWLTQRAIRLQNECFTETGIDEKRLALFLRYQTTHQRAFHKALNTLIRIQKDRRRTEDGFVSRKSPQPTSESGFVSQNADMSPDKTPFPLDEAA